MDRSWDRDDDLEDEEPEDDDPDGDLDAEVEDEEDDALADEEDLEVRREFAEAQRTGVGSEKLLGRLREPGTSPDVSAGDLDADWERADPVGDETVGGTVSTPDQDVVDEIGEAAGVTYRDGEELDPTSKVDRRDVSKWERRLDPSTESDYAERQRELDAGDLDKEDPDREQSE